MHQAGLNLTEILLPRLPGEYWDLKTSGPSPELLTRFIVPSLKFLLCNRPHIPLESIWLPHIVVLLLYQWAHLSRLAGSSAEENHSCLFTPSSLDSTFRIMKTSQEVVSWSVLS